MRFRFLLALFIASVSATPTHGQPFGIGMILNPEGTRLFPQSILFPRHPGKPDPRWKAFEWSFIEEATNQTKYRLYLYDSEGWSARFAVHRIDAEISRLEQKFSYTPSQKFSYLLFTSRQEFRQANIFDISEGIQGVTSTQESTMAIPFWGEAQAFDHISSHELTHQFQIQKTNDLSGYPGRAASSLFPLWFIEGMAEYYSLRGIDLESRMYIKDLILNPDPERHYIAPRFFDEGEKSFIQTYKIGQAKIDFLESRFGEGISQKILESLSENLGKIDSGFKESVLLKTKTTLESIEKDWEAYLEEYRDKSNHPRQPLSAAMTVSSLGQDSDQLIDYYDISPSGEIIAIRELDRETGITSIQLVDLKNHKKKHLLIEDHRPDALSLSFFQSQAFTLTDQLVAYVIETASGSELESRWFHRKASGELFIGEPTRILLSPLKILEVSSIAISPDHHDIALVELDSNGAQNILVIESFLVPRKSKVRRLTHEHYSWKTLSWDTQGILAASDRTQTGTYGIFRVDPLSGTLQPVSAHLENQFSPTSSPDGIWIQSWRSGSPQAHLIQGTEEVQCTALPTGIIYPRLRKGHLFGLVLEKGRFRLAQLTPHPWDHWSTDPKTLSAQTTTPWKPQLTDIDPQRIHPYRPFLSQESKRLDHAGAFLASSGFIGISAVMSDLMRDYVLSANLLALGKLEQTSASVFLTSNKGRSQWTLGAYREIFPMLDNIFPQSKRVRTYLHREAGALAAVKYPLDPFSFFDFQIRIGGVNRGNLSDPAFAKTWQDWNPGSELLVAPTLRFGYDRLIYETYSGPLKGFGALLEVESSLFPQRKAFSNRLRADLSNYWHLPGKTVLQLQAVGATAWGDRYRNSFFVSSDDILRGYPFNDERLYGDSVLAWKSELRFPIGSVFEFPPLRGLIAYDQGSLFSQFKDLNPHLSSSLTAGLTLNIAPLSVNLMLSHPLRQPPGPYFPRVWHFTLRYLYL